MLTIGKKKRIHLKSEHSCHEADWQIDAATITLTVFQSQDPHGVQCVNESKAQAEPLSMGLRYGLQFIMTPRKGLIALPRVPEGLLHRLHTIHGLHCDWHRKTFRWSHVCDSWSLAQAKLWPQITGWILIPGFKLAASSASATVPSFPWAVDWSSVPCSASIIAPRQLGIQKLASVMTAVYLRSNPEIQHP